MVDIVNHYEGTLNKDHGDRIKVLWGAPLEVKDQARKAVECALEMQRCSADIARRDQVAVSGGTLSEMGDHVEAIDLGAVPVKGRAEPLPCWQINRLGEVATPEPAPAPDLPIRRAVIAGCH